VAKRGVCSKELILNRIFPTSGSKLHLSFLWDASILLSKREGSTSANSSSAKIPKTEPLSPTTGELNFAYASDIAEAGSYEPGYVVELLF
jgi:hypothetical protein